MTLVVITGGSRSGKSAAAQRLALARSETGAEVVVAVFGSAEGDEEMAARIDRHRAERPDVFSTVEATDSHSWRERVPDGALLVIECLGTLAALIMSELYEAAADNVDASSMETALDDEMNQLASWLCGRAGDAIIVTNETGWGVVPVHASGRVFRDVVGRANALLIDRADAAYLALGGRLLDLHALPRDVTWPSERE